MKIFIAENIRTTLVRRWWKWKGITQCVPIRRIGSSCALCQQQKLDGRNIVFAYEVFNDHEDKMKKSPILVSHGLFGNKKNWKSLAKRMNAISGREVITYDAVNHGLTSRHTSMSYTDLALDQVILLDELDVSEAIFLGHSMGGKTVMTSALLYPERVKKLVVVDAAPSLSKSMGEVGTYMKTMASMNMAEMKSRNDVLEELKKVVKQFLMTNLITTEEGLQWRINLEAMINNYHFIHSFPEIEKDIFYVKPTLFIGGGRSYYITDVEYPEIYHRFPSAEIKHIEDAGHWVHSDKPTEFINCISNFII